VNIDSRRYADPETYLIPRDRWPELRPEALRLTGYRMLDLSGWRSEVIFCFSCLLLVWVTQASPVATGPVTDDAHTEL
jgi:hypothetical protein